MQRTVCIIDDDPEIQTLLEAFFKKQGCAATLFSEAKPALAANLQADLIVCDLKLPDLDGLEFLEQLRAKGSDLPVIFVTAHGSTETAIEALHRGAFDYITKPINFAELGVIADRAVRTSQLERSHRRLQDQVSRQHSIGGLIGKSHKMRQLYELIERVSVANSSVLITGESGTGKEVVARTVHDRSTRASGPFVAINCAAIPDTLLESELFGHAKGSFTGATAARQGLFVEANGGTLFLDEIGDLPLQLQAKLLRVIQERKVRAVGENRSIEIDVRIVAATHRDLKTAVAEKLFREDLYYRLAVIPVSIPPLRERKEDIPLLVEHFVTKITRQSNSKPKLVTPAAIAKLARMPWPGNVRELENSVERALVLSHGAIIDVADITIDERTEPNNQLGGMFAKLPTLIELEKEYIAYVLRQSMQTKEEAADILGINRKTLYRKEREYGLDKNEAESNAEAGEPEAAV
ncbi:MAG: sigma-54-dependent Fis family transcriptional regulator [Deltaproteobacteria bacterium]|nr:sigma-54-dependent Fis family transcriptional regulator [Deltaproteobacteria bacterium]